MTDATNPILDAIRFDPERVLIDQLFERFGLDILIEHFVESEGVASMHDYILGTHLRLTPVLAPRLCSLLDEVRAALAFDEDVDLFVAQDASVNAASVHSVAEGRPHMLTLTSALVERMNDDELRFVLGHEVGHLAFRHYRARLAAAAFGEDERGAPRVPPLLARRLESWDRLAELSADRAGYVVVEGRLSAAVSAFFKIQSGLGPEHLRFDIQAFLDQLSDLRDLERRELLHRFSHPATPIRVRALQLFDEHRRADEPSRAAMDAEISELSRLMDFEASTPLDINARDFLLAGGLLAAHADGAEVTEREWQTLVSLLLPICADPEAEVARITSPEEATALLDESARWLRDNAGEERYLLFRELARVVAVDGRLLGEEKDFMASVAERLAIPRKASEEMLFDVLADYLQTQASQWTAIPGFARRPSTAPPAADGPPAGTRGS